MFKSKEHRSLRVNIIGYFKVTQDHNASTCDPKYSSVLGIWNVPEFEGIIQWEVSWLGSPYFPHGRSGTAMDYKEVVIAGTELHDGRADMGAAETLSSTWKAGVRAELGRSTRERA